MLLRLAVVAGCLGLVASHALTAQSSTPAFDSTSVTVASPADTAGASSDSAAGPVDVTMRGVTLTAEQKKQIQAIHDKYGALIKALFDSVNAEARVANDSTPVDAQVVPQQLIALQKKHVTELRAVLTSPEQRTPFDANMAAIFANGEMTETLAALKAADPASASQP